MNELENQLAGALLRDFTDPTHDTTSVVCGSGSPRSSRAASTLNIDARQHIQSPQHLHQAGADELTAEGYRDANSPDAAVPNIAAELADAAPMLVAETVPTSQSPLGSTFRSSPTDQLRQHVASTSMEISRSPPSLHSTASPTGGSAKYAKLQQMLGPASDKRLPIPDRYYNIHGPVQAASHHSRCVGKHHVCQPTSVARDLSVKRPRVPGAHGHVQAKEPPPSVKGLTTDKLDKYMHPSSYNYFHPILQPKPIDLPEVPTPAPKWVAPRPPPPPRASKLEQVIQNIQLKPYAPSLQAENVYMGQGQALLHPAGIGLNHPDSPTPFVYCDPRYARPNAKNSSAVAQGDSHSAECDDQGEEESPNSRCTVPKGFSILSFDRERMLKSVSARGSPPLSRPSSATDSQPRSSPTAAHQQQRRPLTTSGASAASVGKRESTGFRPRPSKFEPPSSPPFWQGEELGLPGEVAVRSFSLRSPKPDKANKGPLLSAVVDGGSVDPGRKYYTTTSTTYTSSRPSVLESDMSTHTWTAADHNNNSSFIDDWKYFHHIDQMFVVVSAASINALMQAVRSPAAADALTSPLRRIRAIFSWVAQHVKVDRADTIVRPPNDVMTTKVGNPRSVAQLLHVLLVESGFSKCAVISGYSKLDLSSYSCGQALNLSENESASEAPQSQLHWWNAVKIGRRWHMFDAVYASGYYSSDGQNIFIRRFNSGLFNPPLQLFSLTNFPVASHEPLGNKIHTLQQIYGQTPDLEEFERSLHVGRPFLCYGFRVTPETNTHIIDKTPFTTIILSVPKFTDVRALLRSLEKVETDYDQCSRVRRDFQAGSSQVLIDVVFPSPGDFELMIECRAPEREREYERCLTYRFSVSVDIHKMYCAASPQRLHVGYLQPVRVQGRGTERLVVNQSFDLLEPSKGLFKSHDRLPIRIKGPSQAQSVIVVSNGQWERLEGKSVAGEKGRSLFEGSIQVRELVDVHVHYKMDDMYHQLFAFSQLSSPVPNVVKVNDRQGRVMLDSDGRCFDVDCKFLESRSQIGRSKCEFHFESSAKYNLKFVAKSSWDMPKLMDEGALVVTQQPGESSSQHPITSWTVTFYPTHGYDGTPDATTKIPPQLCTQFSMVVSAAPKSTQSRARLVMVLAFDSRRNAFVLGSREGA